MTDKQQKFQQWSSRLQNPILMKEHEEEEGITLDVPKGIDKGIKIMDLEKPIEEFEEAHDDK